MELSSKGQNRENLMRNGSKGQEAQQWRELFADSHQHLKRVFTLWDLNENDKGWVEEMAKAVSTAGRSQKVE